MGYVFISYSTKNAEQAKMLHKVLTNHGIGVWMAPGNIPVGSSYAGEITRALKGADGLVLLGIRRRGLTLRLQCVYGRRDQKN